MYAQAPYIQRTKGHDQMKNKYERMAFRSEGAKGDAAHAFGSVPQASGQGKTQKLYS